MADRREAPPSKEKILQYWLSFLETDKTDLMGDKIYNVEDNQFISCCWCCGISVSSSEKFANLQVCHVIPHSLEGVNTELNYVLMCPTCHSEAPNIKSRDCFFYWFKHKESFYTTLSKQFLHLVVKNQKTIETFSKVFDILNIEETFLDIVKKIITEETSTHGSVITTSTREAVLQLAMTQFIAKLKHEMFNEEN